MAFVLTAQADPHGGPHYHRFSRGHQRGHQRGHLGAHGKCDHTKEYSTGYGICPCACLLSFRCLGANFKVFVANVFGAKARLSLTPVHRRECQSRALGKLPRTLIRAALVPQTRLRPGDGLPPSRDSGERIIFFDNLRRPPPPGLRECTAAGYCQPGILIQKR